MLRRHLCGHGATRKYIFSSPIGDLEIVNCPKGVVSLKMKGTVISKDDFAPNKSITVKCDETLKNDDNDRIAKVTKKWLETYFISPEKVPSMTLPPVCFMTDIDDNAPFTKKVWHALATKVPLGKAVSYGELAVLSGGTTKSSRAVGSAMRNNPVSIIVPCHRVILSSGALGNYSGGNKNCVKQWLLQHEGSISDNK